MNRFAYGVAAVSLLSLLASPVFADALKDACVTGQKGDPNGDKNCTCLASKIKPEDQALALKTMNAFNDAEKAGKPIEDTNPPADLVPGMKIVFEALAQCL